MPHPHLLPRAVDQGPHCIALFSHLKTVRPQTLRRSVGCHLSLRTPPPRRPVCAPPQGTPIYTGCVVENVSWAGKRIHVTLEDGRECTASHIVTTFPIGVLQDHLRADPKSAPAPKPGPASDDLRGYPAPGTPRRRPLFTPALPQDKVEAVLRLGMGNEEQVLFPSAARVGSTAPLPLGHPHVSVSFVEPCHGRGLVPSRPCAVPTGDGADNSAAKGQEAPT